MSPKGYQRVHRGTKKQAGRRYFVAYGKAHAAAHALPRRASRTSARRIWPPASGPSAAQAVRLCAVLMFVKPGRGYQPRFDMDKVAKRADAEAYLGRRIRYRLREAAGV